jgi:hypothetical protein
MLDYVIGYLLCRYDLHCSEYMMLNSGLRYILPFIKKKKYLVFLKVQYYQLITLQLEFGLGDMLRHELIDCIYLLRTEDQIA